MVLTLFSGIAISLSMSVVEKLLKYQVWSVWKLIGQKTKNITCSLKRKSVSQRVPLHILRVAF